MKLRALKKLKGKAWLATGFISYLALVIYGAAGTVKGMDFINAVMSVIDWLAAGIIFFFLGAIIGHIIDLATNKKSEKLPEWLLLTLVLWALSTVLLAIFANKDLISWTLILIFPLAYGVFFHGLTFIMLFPSSWESSPAAKTVFDLFYLAFFTLWLKLPNKKKLLKKSMLWLVFLILFLGMFGCVVNLS